MSVIINCVHNMINHITAEDMPLNSPGEVLNRFGRKLKVSANITGNNNSYQANVFKITGSVRIIDQYAMIVSIVDLTNMTNIYADLWDGTVSVLLTADGMTLSGAPVGSFFTKDKDSSETYSLNLADQCRMSEVSAEGEIGKPFTVTQKNGVDTFIRFCYTTNQVLDYNMDIFFTYQLLDGSNLEVA